MKYVSLGGSCAFILLLFIALSGAKPLFAQLDDSSASGASLLSGTGVQEQIDTNVTPTNPQPYSTVTVTVDSYSSDINSATMSWSVNGKVVKTGKGLKTFSFNAGPLGTVSIITLDVQLADGETVEKTVTVSAQSVDILWEADSYVPPFYKGRSFYATQGHVTFMAMPNLIDANGKTIDPHTLIYTWKINDTVDEANSGYGVNSYVYTGDILGQEILAEVHVSDAAGDVSGDGSLIIDPTNTEVYAYEDNPTYGILFNNAITDGFNLTNNEITLSAFPYFFNVSSRSDPALAYKWSINSSLINAPETQKDIVFRNTDNSSGESDVSLGVANNDKINQTANNSFTIELNPQKGEQPFNF